MPDGNFHGRPDRGRSEEKSAVDRLRAALGELADIRAPQEAEQPILSPTVRVALAQWMVEIRMHEQLKAVGVKPRKTCVLKGPPGTGKTTLAHHLAGRLGIPMVIVGPETIVSKYLGDSARNAAELFDGIKKAKTPCLLFLDELDALGGSRDGMGGSACDRENLSMLTVIMRKIEEYDGLLISATNRPEAIDPALWRRFHMQLSVDIPEYEQRWAIIKRYSLPFDWSDEDIHLLTALTDSASPALIRQLMEGVKRALVIYPAQAKPLPVDDPKAVFLPIIRSVEPPPHPNLKRPPLWSNESLTALDAFGSWPPRLQE